MFELKIKGETILLKWGTLAMKKLCDLMGITIDEFFAILQKIADGKATTDEMFKVIENFIKAGYYSANGSLPNESDVYDWIDHCGGIIKINDGQLVEYINYVVSVTLNGITPLTEVADEKKNGA